MIIARRRLLLAAAVAVAMLVSSVPARSERTAPARNPGASATASRLVDVEEFGTILALNLNTYGYLGNALSRPDAASLEYPRGSHVEHLYAAGLWVGARTPGGDLRVSCVTADANGIDEIEAEGEFDWDDVLPEFRSNLPGSPHHHPDAVATTEVLFAFHDDAVAPDHVPLGLRVELHALAWNQALYDDAIVLEYRIINVSGAPLLDVYVGHYQDATVGNTDLTDPYDPEAPVGWNFWDDMNGAWRPGDVPSDPDLWAMYKRDDDGEGGLATSWVGCRLLDLDPPAEPGPGLPPVSYNAWRFRGVPDHDDAYLDDEGVVQPGRYQLMGNGHFDVGQTEEDDFSAPSDWMALLSTGPVPSLAAGDTLTAAFAMICGPDSTGFLNNATAIAAHHAGGYPPVAAPPPVAATTLTAHPNPFNPTTVLQYDLPAAAPITLTVHALDGTLVRTLVAAHRAAGRHAVRWDGRDHTGRPVASGRYLARLRSGDTRVTRGLTLVR